MTKYLFLLDMDGTLTKNTSWRDLLDYLGIKDEVDYLKEMFSKGEITYEEWATKELEHYISKNLTKKQVEQIMERYEYREGVEYFFDTFRDSSLFVVLSAGIWERVEHISKNLGAHYYHGTKFLYSLEGYVIGYEYLFEPRHKHSLAKFYKSYYAPKKYDVVAIGDSDFDNYMFDVADIAISIETSSKENIISDSKINSHYHVKNFYEVVDILKKK